MRKALLAVQDKNAALKAAGAIVPGSFEGFEGIIKRTYDELVEAGQIQPQPESEVKTVPMDLDAAKKAGKVSPTGSLWVDAHIALDVSSPPCISTTLAVTCKAHSLSGLRAIRRSVWSVFWRPILLVFLASSHD